MTETQVQQESVTSPDDRSLAANVDTDRVWARFARVPARVSLKGVLREWIAPIVFALIVYGSIKGLATGQPFWDFQGSLMSVSAAVFLMAMARGRRLDVPRRIAWAGALLLISIAISVVLSPGMTASLRRLYIYAAVVSFGIAIYVLYRDADRIPLDRYCVAVGLAHFPFLREVIYWVLASEGPLFVTNVSVPNFWNVRHFGYLGFLAASCGTALLVVNKKLDVTAFALTCAGLFGVILMGSRGAFLSWIMLVLMLIWCRPEKLRILAMSFAAFALTGAAVHYLYVSDLLVTPNLFVRIASANGGSTIDSGRVDVWLQTLGAIADRPLFGYGPEAYYVSRCCVEQVVQPHNSVLQFLMEFGAVGCGLAGLLVARLVESRGGMRRVFKLCKASPESVALVCLIASFLGFSLIDGMFYYQFPLMHFALFVGLLCAAMNQAERMSTDSAADALPAS